VGSSILPEMARKIRIQYLGAVDQVMRRNNRWVSVDKEVQDRKFFLRATNYDSRIK
jgi:hypothetical protein